MSKLFYDDYIDLAPIEKKIKEHVKSKESQEEIYKLIDEILHHRVVGCILDRLPSGDHDQFVQHLSDRPHDTGIMRFLGDRIAEDVVEFIRYEVHKLSGEILEIIHETSAPKTLPKKLKK